MWSKAPLFLLGLLTASCAGRAPPPPRTDSAVVDADGGPSGGSDAGPPVQLMRPDGGPRLPAVDREIVLSYLGDSAVEDLEVEGAVGTMDVFFSIDTTGSFGGEIDNLQSSLRTRILPELRARVADVRLGVGRFEDFPAPPFGDADDRPFRLLTPITARDGDVSSAVASLDQPLGNGGDIEEASAEALWQIATGSGYGTVVPPYRGTGLGGVGFREDALRAVVHVTDAPTHEPRDYGDRFPNTHTVDESITAMRELGVRVLGIASGGAARLHLEDVALGTGATIEPEGGMCATGIDGELRPTRDGVCPLVFDVNPDGSGVGDAVIDAIVGLLSSIQYEEVWAETDDRLGFVRTIEAVDATAPPDIDPPTLADRRPAGDGLDDTFLGVGPGTQLSFRAVLRNETIPPADYDQIFNLELRVIGDGVTLLTRRLRIIVPRGRIDAGAAPTPDAGPPTPDAGATMPPDAGIDAGIDAG